MPQEATKGALSEYIWDILSNKTNEIVLNHNSEYQISESMMIQANDWISRQIGEKRQISHAEEFQNNLCRYSILKKEDHHYTP